MKRKRKRKRERWTAGDSYLAVLGVVFGFVFVLLILQKIGLLDNDPLPVSTSPGPHRFDNRKCLEQNALRIRRADPTVADDDLSGQVARACAVEREQFEHW